MLRVFATLKLGKWMGRCPRAGLFSQRGGSATNRGAGVEAARPGVDSKQRNTQVRDVPISGWVKKMAFKPEVGKFCADARYSS